MPDCNPQNIFRDCSTLKPVAMVRPGSERGIAAKLAATFLLCVGLAACTTSGKPFDTEGLNHLVPGATTFAQATAALGAQPVDVYRANDGSLVARWAQKYTWVSDAMYWRKEVWLAFDAYGRYTHQVENVNATPLPKEENQANTGQGASASTSTRSADAVMPINNAAASIPEAPLTTSETASDPLGSLPTRSVEGAVVLYPVQIHRN